MIFVTVWYCMDGRFAMHATQNVTFAVCVPAAKQHFLKKKRKKIKKFKKTVDFSKQIRYNIEVVSYGSIAQLGEHLPYKQRVTGSSPVVPTRQPKGHSFGNVLFCFILIF